MRHGFLLVDKESGPTSHDVVSEVRRRLQERDIGHIGTLDPAASGLLVLAVGSKALKVIEFFRDLPKEYDADVCLGSVSTTYDGEGVIEEVKIKPGWVMPDELMVRRIIDDHFIGSIRQVPPLHSAVHVHGQRAYALARKGVRIELPERKVEIGSCVILSYAYPHLRLHMACGSGTYVRSLAHDLGGWLRCGGFLKGLRRTRVGEWSIEDAVASDNATWTDILPLKTVLKDFHGVEITDEEAKHVCHGRKISREVRQDTIAWYKDLPIAILIPAKDGSRSARPRKVF